MTKAGLPDCDYYDVTLGNPAFQINLDPELSATALRLFRP